MKVVAKDNKSVIIFCESNGFSASTLDQKLRTQSFSNRLLTICGQDADVDEVLHKLYMELLKRMDDASDDIRITVTKTWAAFFKVTLRTICIFVFFCEEHAQVPQYVKLFFFSARR